MSRPDTRPETWEAWRHVRGLSCRNRSRDVTALADTKCRNWDNIRDADIRLKAMCVVKNYPLRLVTVGRGTEWRKLSFQQEGNFQCRAIEIGEPQTTIMRTRLPKFRDRQWVWPCARQSRLQSAETASPWLETRTFNLMKTYSSRIENIQAGNLGSGRVFGRIVGVEVPEDGHGLSFC